MAVRAERGPAALSPLRTVALAIGFVCAISASVAIFLTDDARYLRIAILIALWGFVFAALAAGRRQTEQVAAASAEVELRRSYELELDREVAARREYELRLESQLRRELQDDFATQVGGLREEMTRLRRELSEQWDSELRVERMVMRTQSVRMGERREALEQASPDRAIISPAPAEAPGWDAGRYDDRYVPTESTGAAGANGAGGAAGANGAVGAAGATGTAAAASAADPNDVRTGTTEFPAVSPDPPSYPLPPSLPPVATADLDDPQTAALPPTPAATYRPPPPPPASYGPPPPASYGSPPAAPYRPPAPNPYTSQSEPDPDDVLARVLAEAGGSTAGRRRKHRYADEDDAVPYGY